MRPGLVLTSLGHAASPVLLLGLNALSTVPAYDLALSLVKTAVLRAYGHLVELHVRHAVGASTLVWRAQLRAVLFLW